MWVVMVQQETSDQYRTSGKVSTRSIHRFKRYRLLKTLTKNFNILSNANADANAMVTATAQDQDQDNLLVKRRNDNHSPGPVIRELVPSSHQRSELSNTVFSSTWYRWPNNEPPHDKTKKKACAPSEDSDQPGRLPSLIRVFTIRMKKACVLSYPLCTLWRFWSDWADAVLGYNTAWSWLPKCHFPTVSS